MELGMRIESLAAGDISLKKPSFLVYIFLENSSIKY